MLTNYKYLIVSANVRYWEDTTVDGIEDSDGSQIPCRSGNSWDPIIELKNGQIINWNSKVEADIHYKICDAGQYWLADENQNKKFKWSGDYVPDKILCVGDKGYGDYIILKVDKNGFILRWKTPEIEEEDWIEEK